MECVIIYIKELGKITSATTKSSGLGSFCYTKLQKSKTWLNSRVLLTFVSLNDKELMDRKDALITANPMCIHLYVCFS